MGIMNERFPLRSEVVCLTRKLDNYSTSKLFFCAWEALTDTVPGARGIRKDDAPRLRVVPLSGTRRIPVEKIASVRVVFVSLGVVMNQSQDAYLLVQQGGPTIPARLFEGAWTGYVVANKHFGDNYVQFTDARPYRGSGEVRIARFEGFDPTPRVAMESHYSVRNQTKFEEPLVYGLFEQTIDVYDMRQIPALRQFLQELGSGFIRIGAKKSTNGIVKIQSVDWRDASGNGFDTAAVQLPVLVKKTRRQYYKCVVGHRQSAKIREHGGQCPKCGREVEPEWLRKADRRPWLGEPRKWGDLSPIMDEVEAVLNRDLGLELPWNTSRVYWPPFAEEPQYDLVEVNEHWLKNRGLPTLPWAMETCRNWRARLDVLAGLAIIFKAQPGVSVEIAVTAAAVVHRLLTGFRLTPENSGTWAGSVNEKRAQEVLETVWERINATIEFGKRTPDFQEITSWVMEEFGSLLHTPSSEYISWNWGGAR